MILSQLKNLKSYRIQALVFLVIVFYTLFLFSNIALAQGVEPPAGILSGGGIGVENFIYSIATGVGGIFLWIGGSLLDYAIQYLVIGMGGFLNANLGVVIDQMWVVVRDFFNILFIFGLIYIGFRTILSSGDTNTKKAVGYLVIAALMINFSLFITKAIIDFSNIAAFQVYNAIIAEGENDPQTATIGIGAKEGAATASGGEKIPIHTATVGGNGVRSISASFVNAVNFTSYADGTAIKEMRSSASVISGQFIIFGIVMMFMMIFAGFVFAAGAFILVARFIVLVIAMILSPMMFLGMIFPLLGKYGKDWWHKFLSNAFVAPAYLFMIYLSLWAIQGIADPKGGSFAGAFVGDSTTTGTFFIFLYFFVVMGFLYMSLHVAKAMSAHGSSVAMSSVDFLRKEAQGIAGRNTVGRAGVSFDESLKNAGFSEKSTLRRLTGKATNAKFGSLDSRPQVVDAADKAGRIVSRRKIETDIEDAANQGDTVRLERLLRSANKEQITGVLKRMEPGTSGFNNLISNLKDSQFEAVMTSKEEDIDDGLKNKIGSARQISVEDKIRNIGSQALAGAVGTTQAEQMQAGISKANAAELKALGVDTVVDNAGLLTMKQIEDIKKGDYTKTEIDKIITSNKTQLIKQFDENPESIFKVHTSSEARAKLPSKIITDERALHYLSPGSLSQMINHVDESDREVIKDNISRLLVETDHSKALKEWLRTPRGREF
jgi:hypothetical protein